MFSSKIKLIILGVIAVLLIGAGYFYYSKNLVVAPLPSASNPVLPVETKSLADDKEYVDEKIKYFLDNNPAGTSREYATDVIYQEIAFNEQNRAVCNRIKSEEVKNQCYRMIKK